MSRSPAHRPTWTAFRREGYPFSDGGNNLGRIRLGRSLTSHKTAWIAFIDAVVEPGSTVHSDGWQEYCTVPEHGYAHERTVMRNQNDPAHVVMPGVHRIASLLQRGLPGTHQGGVSPEHLDAYLNEFRFRFNRRHSNAQRQRPLPKAERRGESKRTRGHSTRAASAHRRDRRGCRRRLPRAMGRAGRSVSTRDPS